MENAVCEGGEEVIPETVMIGYASYEVKVSLFPSDNITGEIDYYQQTILLREGMSAEMTVKTLYHEIIHGMLYALGSDGEPHDEKLVDGLANMLAVVARDNPGLFDIGKPT